MNDGSIPVKIAVPWGNSAPPGDITTPIPVPSQISVTPGRASFTDGFPPANFQPEASGGIPPFGQDVNGIINQITQWVRWLIAGAPVPYDPTFQSGIGGYPSGSIVASVTYAPTTFWLSTADNNLSDPDTGGANWAVFGGKPTTSISGPSETYSQSQAGFNVVRSNSGSPMIDTLPGPSGLLFNQTLITVTNGDASGTLALNSGAPIKGAAFLAPNNYLYLGPGQAATFLSDGTNYWLIESPGRCKMPSAGFTFYVSPTGSDANHGLTAAAPLGTMQNAYNYCQGFFDLAGNNFTIQLANGTYTTGMGAEGKLTGQGYVVQCSVVGNNSNPSDIIIDVTNGSSCLAADDGAQFGYSGVTLQNSAAPTVNCQRAGSIIVQGPNVIFNAVGGGYAHIAIYSGGEFIVNGNYIIEGSAGFHIAATNAGRFEALLTTIVTVQNGPTFATAFVYATGSGSNINAAGMSFTGTAKGQKYNVSFNAVISSGGNVFPGDSPGAASAGGQYS